LGPRVFGGVAVGCVGRNTVLLDSILLLGVRRQHTLVFLNTPPMLFLQSYIEHRAALQGLTRAAMAVAPPWGVVLLRTGLPGPMPTF
jgi:hypothetical protein